MTALALHEVWKTRGHGARAVRAVRGVTLEVAPGEVVLVEGPSGAGKTTLLLVAAGLLTPERGEVVLVGERLAALAPGERRLLRARALGFVFQRPNLLDRLTVRENVLVAAALAGVPPRLAVERTATLLARLGLAQLSGRTPATLSAGEEQRVAVARALVHLPSVVLADEPTGSLDAASGAAVTGALVQLAQQDGVAVVIATHDPRLGGVGARRAWMADGQLAPDPPPLPGRP